MKGIGRDAVLKGRLAFYKKNYTLAQKYFEQALSKNPLDPVPYINLAIIEDVLGRPDKALQIYDIVVSRLSAPELEPMSYFAYYNMGELNGRLGRRDQALKNYQQALDSFLKMDLIKQNIELLFREPEQNQTNKKNQEPKGDKNKKTQSQGQNEDLGQNKKKPVPKKSKGKNLEKPDPLSKEEKSQISPIGDTEEKAILEEVEKQENKVRWKFYKRGKPFGDKVKKDW